MKVSLKLYKNLIFVAIKNNHHLDWIYICFLENQKLNEIKFSQDKKYQSIKIQF